MLLLGRLCYTKKEREGSHMPITWGNYTFSTPVRLTTWIPQSVPGVYAISVRRNDSFSPIYFGETEDLAARGINNTHHAYDCWLSETGSEQDIYVSVHPMANSTESDRRRVEDSLITQYNPVCNR